MLPIRCSCDMPRCRLCRWSQSERAFLPELNYVATIPNGIGMSQIPVGGGDGGYRVFRRPYGSREGP